VAPAKLSRQPSKQVSATMEQSQQYERVGPAALFDFSFRTFITLGIIKALYILGMVLIALAWLIVVIGAFVADFWAGLGVLITYTLIAIIQLIFLRVWLEMIVVFFRIGENTSILVQGQTATATNVAPPSAQ
jgi:hypothetical protein